MTTLLSFPKIFLSFSLNFRLCFWCVDPGERGGPFPGETTTIQKSVPEPVSKLLSSSVGRVRSLKGWFLSLCGKSCLPGKGRWRRSSVFFSLNLEDWGAICRCLSCSISLLKQGEMRQTWGCKCTVQYCIQNNVISTVILLLSISCWYSQGRLPLSCSNASPLLYIRFLLWPFKPFQCLQDTALRSLWSPFISDSDGSV